MRVLNSLPNNYVRFMPAHLTEDLYMFNIGHNDFNSVKPICIDRQQSFFSLHFVIHGKGILNINGISHVVEANQLFLIPPETIIRYYPSDSDPWRYVWLSFNGSKAEELLSNSFITRQSPICKCDCYMDILNTLIPLYENLNYDDESLNMHSTAALFRILSLIRHEFITAEFKNKKNDNFYVDKILNYININYKNQYFALSDVCLTLNLSHSYICKIFKRTVGKSIASHLIDIRIEKAKLLLAKTLTPIREIATSIGYNDERYFSKEFRRLTGMSPSEFRKNPKVFDF